MVESIENKVIAKIKKAKKGTIFFAENFLDFGKAKTIQKALARLTEAGELHRVATGMYVRPMKSNFFDGILLPDTEEIAQAIAKRDKARLMPTGSYAMYKLGLTTQVPMNVVYYTDASARKVVVGKRTIKFKKASAKNLSYIGKISTLAVLALKEIGKGKVYEHEIQKIRNILAHENPNDLAHDLQLAPAWIREMIGTIEHKENE